MKAMNKTWVQYGIAAAIVLIGCLLSLLILLRPWEIVHHQVEFYSCDGTLLQTQQVEDGRSAQPPLPVHEGHIFKHWDKDLFSVTEDLQVYPVCEKIPEQKNVVYADVVYGKTEDICSVTPRLSGLVDCSGFTIEMGYDDALLHFEGAESVLDGLTVEHRDGVVTMTWSSDVAIAEETDLAVLYFKCTKEGSYSTTFPLLTKKIVTLAQDGEVYTDSTAYDGKLYLYQK